MICSFVAMSCLISAMARSQFQESLHRPELAEFGHNPLWEQSTPDLPSVQLWRCIFRPFRPRSRPGTRELEAPDQIAISRAESMTYSNRLLRGNISLQTAGVPLTAQFGNLMPAANTQRQGKLRTCRTLALRIFARRRPP